MTRFLFMAMTYLLIVMVPIFAGYGTMRLALRWREQNTIDYTPWKVMAVLAIAPTLIIIATIVWVDFIPTDYAEFKSPISSRAKLINAISLVSLLMPGAYAGAAVTGAIKGTSRPRAYIWVFALLAPMLFGAWYFLVLALSCVMIGSCL